jgi:ATP-dependent Clp protease ATP-binding subunit ClpB
LASSAPPGGGGGGGGVQLPSWLTGQAQPEGHYLKEYTTDLTELARANKLDPVIGRHDEINRVIQILSRKTKNCPVLIGSAGVGKTAIAEGLATRIVSGQVPESMRNKQVLSLDMTSLMSSTAMRGQLEERMKGVSSTIIVVLWCLCWTSSRGAWRHFHLQKFYVGRAHTFFFVLVAAVYIILVEYALVNDPS